MYVKLNSWHIVSGDKTLCGKDYGPDNRRADDWGSEKSCESCLRSQRKLDAQRPA